jgi:hypothetical protein
MFNKLQDTEEDNRALMLGSRLAEASDQEQELLALSMFRHTQEPRHHMQEALLDELRGRSSEALQPLCTKEGFRRPSSIKKEG